MDPKEPQKRSFEEGDSQRSTTGMPGYGQPPPSVRQPDSEPGSENDKILREGRPETLEDGPTEVP